jgi:hypothetical protein
LLAAFFGQVNPLAQIGGERKVIAPCSINLEQVTARSARWTASSPTSWTRARVTRCG